MVKELFKSGSETVEDIDGRLYVSGVGYQFKVTQLDNTFMTAGKVKPETIEFLRQHLSLSELMDN